ncbi:MAG: polyprenyl synthetase family protein [Candidatus Bathyarchaeota archaeon]|nr:polyprenyl synthetase family protein [Candidatus Bathyarchaeota archaeon]MCW3991773.1 polyprenyl synthetase family protein [Candidatus Bathyarchaeota archaeon]
MLDFKGMLRERQDFVNEVVEGLRLSNVHPLLEVPTKYAILSGGKRLRPLICMLCTEVVGGDYTETREAFLALELIHNGTLIHDDMIDDDLYRRGKPSAQVRFGGKVAVLTGDALLSLGLKYATETGNLSVVEWLSETALKMVQGVALQTYYRRELVSETTYLEINYLKSGSLFETAAAIGGLIGSGSQEDSGILADFGRSFGNAYQIRDDICGVYSENENDDLSRSDILNGDVTLPFIYALDSELLADSDRECLMAVYHGKTVEIDREEIQRVYEETGALERSINKMKEFAEMGSESLDHFERTEAKDCLDHMLHRYYLDFNPKMVEIIV